MRTGWANTLFFAKIRKIVICIINLPLFDQILGNFGEAPICFIPKSYLSLPMFFNSFNVWQNLNLSSDLGQVVPSR